MEIKFFSSLAKESAKGMFVIDKHGRTILFPWGAKRQGYLVKDNLASNFKKFYSYIFSFYFIALVVLTALFHSFWSIVEVFLACSISAWFVYYVYTSKITKSLTIVRASYKEIVLEKIEYEASQDVSYEIPASTWRSSSIENKKESLSSLKRFLSYFSPGRLAMLSFLTGFLAVAVELSFHPQKYSGSVDSWLVFFPCFFFGLGGFLIFFFGEAPEEGILGLIRWKLPMLGVMIVFWLLAFWSLYDFIVATAIK